MAVLMFVKKKIRNEIASAATDVDKLAMLVANSIIF